MKLAAQTIKGLAASGKPRTFWDDSVKGFGVLCRPPSARSPQGSASWIIEYRPGAGGRRVGKRRYVIGPVDQIEAVDARKTAKDLLAGVRTGNDPAAGRREAREAATIRELAERYQAEVGHGGAAGGRMRKDSTVELYSGYWRIHILPEIGGVKARDLTRTDVRRLHRQIGESHQATANRCVGLLRNFYNWAAREGEGGVVEGVNPARGVSRYNESGKERYLSHDELSRLSDALERAETIGIPWPEPPGGPSKHRPIGEEHRRTRISAGAAAAIRLLLLTGARLREILHLRWEHVDFDRGALFLPDSKTGRKTIILGGAALTIIEGLRAKTNGQYVIAGDDPDKPRADLQRPWALVRRGADLPGVRLHDLRHTFASFGASGGLGLTMIGGLLGHKDSKTTQRYAHLANDPLRRAADLIAGGLEAAMRGTAPARPAEGTHGY